MLQINELGSRAGVVTCPLHCDPAQLALATNVTVAANSVGNVLSSFGFRIPHVVMLPNASTSLPGAAAGLLADEEVGGPS